MSAPIIQHEAIKASAGSGKTFQLAHRYVRLMAAGVAPDRIIAITFSRKAAGEIFTAIVTLLCEGAIDPAKAKATAGRIENPKADPAFFAELLRRFLQALPRLSISTIDSFTIGILKSFPVELGISPVFSVMDNESEEAQQIRREALTSVFRLLNRDQDAQQSLLESFKQATFGREGKTFACNFDDFIADHHGQYKLLPDGAAWGGLQRIWPNGNPWLEPVGTWDDLIAALRERYTQVEWNTYAQGKWHEFIEALATHDFGTPWKSIAYLADRLLALHASLREGRASLKINRKEYTITGPLAETSYQLVHYLMQQNLLAACDSTQGIYRLLDCYEQLYDAQFRRPGQITFDDAQFLLTRSGKPISREPDNPARLYIDYRLDRALDHWLIDEFQDTSDLQWQVFQNLADEILQDTSGERSFFFVGDVKQAIYAWRGGNHKLFTHILDTYGEDRIHPKTLDVSYRSSAPVLDLVNHAFSTLHEEVPEPVAEAWQPIWKAHECRKDKEPPPGYAALLEVGVDKDDVDARFRACADLLNLIRPLERGLSVALLVRRNSTAQKLANVLRSACPDLPIAVDGASALADNPVVLVLCSLIRQAVHPGDTLAVTHVRMSPLYDATRHLKAEDILRELYTDGYQSFLQHWGEVLDAAHTLDAFGRHRLKQAIDAAGEFDAGERNRPEDFLSFMAHYPFSEKTSDATVRIMTVHKSKGLGFDMVILPDLPDGGSMLKRRDDPIWIARNEEDQPHWALQMPNTAIVEQDEVLNRERTRSEEDACFEQLCVLYVALTRAKQGLYCITNPPPKSETALTFSRYLREQLPSAPADAEPFVTGETRARIYYEQGTRDWHNSSPLRQAPAQEKAVDVWPAQFEQKRSMRRRLLRVNPSARAEAPRKAHMLFLPTVTRSLEFGTAVHGLFEQIEWSDDYDWDAIVRSWEQQSGTADAEAVAHVEAALAVPEIANALRKPSRDAVVWRERNFEAVLDNDWITGIFDRVVLERNAKGHFDRGLILDYKTNDVNESTLTHTVEHYRPQLTLYAQALSKLTGVPVSNIRCALCFTRLQRVVEV